MGKPSVVSTVSGLKGRGRTDLPGELAPLQTYMRLTCDNGSVTVELAQPVVRDAEEVRDLVHDRMAHNALEILVAGGL